MSLELVKSDIDIFSEKNDSKEKFNDSNDLYNDILKVPENQLNEDILSTSVSPYYTINQELVSAVYIGNLTWWTTDQDIINTLRIIGVTDVVEVKFFENRGNGQSKGFCVVALSSEADVKATMDGLQEKVIHGRKPKVMKYTKQNLSYFENQYHKLGPDKENISEKQAFENDISNNFCNMSNERSKGRCDNTQPYPFKQTSQPHVSNFLSGGPPSQYLPPYSRWIPTSPSQVHRMSLTQSTYSALPLNTTPLLPVRFQSMPPPLPNVIVPRHLRIPSVNIRDPILTNTPSYYSSNFRGSCPSHEWIYPKISQPFSINVPHHNIQPTRIPPSFQNSTQTTTTHLPRTVYFHSQNNIVPNLASSQLSDSYDRSSSECTNYLPSYKQEPPSCIKLDSEEIMNRNKMVSSSAITRAVFDASEGDYASAIETLVTAISLIKQSKVVNDERCKILISTLQDTLHGVESRSYNSKGDEQSHSKRREKYEKSSNSDKISRYDRSRSRDKDYRDHGKGKDKYHDGHYRDKDRNHNHKSNRH